MTRTGPDVRAGNVSTLPEALRLRCEKQPDEIAYVFLRDGEEPDGSLTYRQLEIDAGSRAAALERAGLSGGNAVLLYPSGLEFVRALLGCMYARVAAPRFRYPPGSVGWSGCAGSRTTRAPALC